MLNKFVIKLKLHIHKKKLITSILRVYETQVCKVDFSQFTPKFLLTMKKKYHSPHLIIRYYAYTPPT